MWDAYFWNLEIMKRKTMWVARLLVKVRQKLKTLFDCKSLASSRQSIENKFAYGWTKFYVITPSTIQKKAVKTNSNDKDTEIQNPEKKEPLSTYILRFHKCE